MSLQHQQDLIARLFTDEKLRNDFSSDAASVGTAFGLDRFETDELKAIVPAELKFFADSLFWKRRNEVEKLLPLTRIKLGDEFNACFHRFASCFVPVSNRKHLEDAYVFCGFLATEDVGETASEAARYEQAKIEFFLYGKRIVFRRIRYGLFAEGIHQSRKIRYCLWLKLFNIWQHWVW